LESRRIIFLTEGYLNGWLDFKPRTGFSRLRENHIINFLERKYSIEAIKLQVHIASSLASGNLQEKTVSLAYDAYDQYVGTALPYLDTKANIEEEKKPIDKEQLTAWKALLAQKKKEMSGFIKSTEVTDKQELKEEQ
jgi:hypothetical protein